MALPSLYSPLSHFLRTLFTHGPCPGTCSLMTPSASGL